MNAKPHAMKSGLSSLSMSPDASSGVMTPAATNGSRVAALLRRLELGLRSPWGHDVQLGVGADIVQAQLMDLSENSPSL
jgi:hypothetical protein